MIRFLSSVRKNNKNGKLEMEKAPFFLKKISSRLLTMTSSDWISTLGSDLLREGRIEPPFWRVCLSAD